MPVSAIDYVTGHLLAAGTMAALERRAREGGSWLVETSLARIGLWISDLGVLDRSVYTTAPEDLPEAEIARLCSSVHAPDGRIRHLGPIVSMSETPPHWARPPVPLAYHEPFWLARDLMLFRPEDARRGG
jgi:hypothetical protein